MRVWLTLCHSRFRGNDKAVFLVYRQEPHGPGPRPPRRPAAGHWLCGHAMPRVRLNLLRGSLRKRGFIRSSLPTFYEVQTLSKVTGQHNAKMKSILPSQVSFAQAEYDKKKKRTRRELFLEQMEQVPWARLIEVIEPHYPKGGKRGHPPTGWARSLSDVKEIGCKRGGAAHGPRPPRISPLSWAIERLLPGEIVTICPRSASFSLRFFKSDRLLGCRLNEK